jgi:lipoprotein-anchoring transpeptidase ErfK/SrfK
MRAAIRSVVAITTIAASVCVAPAGAAHTSAQSRTLGQAYRSSESAVTSVRPGPGDVVGVAHPVVVAFRTPVTDRTAAERALNLTSTPAMTGKFEWLDTTTVQWVPDRFWPAHSTVALSVGGRPTKFATGPKVVGVASISDHTFTVTIDGAQAGPPTSLPAPHHRPRWGQAGVFPATMGRAQFPTPVGIFTVLGKERSVVMDSSTVGIPVSSPDGYHLNVDYAVRFTSRGLFVHAAPWAVNSMGHDNVSHGCISLSTEDAEWYYNTVNVGDPVIVRENSLEVPSEPKMGIAY